MRIKKYIKYIIFSLVFLTTGCLKIEEASIIPEIELISFETVEGTEPEFGNKAFRMDLNLSFIDGDGDIGSQDSTEFSLFITPLRKKNDTIADTLDTLPFNIPYVEPLKTVRTLNGEINCVFYIYKIGEYHLNDTFVFEVYITDRAEHNSNVVSTEEDFIFTFTDN